jgi:hypothetical protein
MKKVLSFIFNKKFWLNKWTIIVTSIIVVVSGVALTYLYSPSFVPQIIKSANKKVVDKIIGKELAERIDETRDENGATSIRALFNSNKEENLARHCEKKEEKEKEQGKCYKTYKNEEFGFSVKYPENLESIENKSLSSDHLNSISFWKKEKDPNDLFPEFQIDVFNKISTSDTSLNWTNRKNDPPGFISDISEIKKGNYSWVKAIEAGDPDHIIYVTSANSKIYQITTPINEIENINEIIQSFQTF